MSTNSKYVRKCRQKKAKWLADMKSSPCMDCGIQYPPRVMQWDHVRGTKEFTLANAIRANISRGRIMSEIEKCDLVCANCHAMRHM